MAAPTNFSTKQKLLSLIEDVEIISKELLDHLATPKKERPEGIDTSKLIELLVHKDKEIQKTLDVAKDQAELQKKMDALKEQVEKRDQDIRMLQKNLKDAESILATAIYQAKQKLQSINQANKRKINSEELIKYAHTISVSHAVAAPPTWAPGDPSRRPYPVDLDMRRGWLAGVQTAEIPVAQMQQQQQQHSAASGLSWQSNMDGMQAGGSSLHAASAMDSKGHGAKEEEVELMSSDSSSSSSSDE